MLLALDAAIIRYGFQPIVDALAPWRSHFGLAMLAMCIACGCAVLTAGLLVVKPDLWFCGPLYLLLAYSWGKRAQVFAYLEQVEAEGRLDYHPSLAGALNRLLALLTLVVFCLIAGTAYYAIPWISFLIGWTLATCAYYFAACRAGTPRRQHVWKPS